MITHTQYLNPEPSLFQDLPDTHPQDLLFFDIETTGLRVQSSALYLIGALLCQPDGHWELQQFFSEGLHDEPELIRAFQKLLSGKKVLITYNGDNFDFPFLQRTAESYELNLDFSKYVSLDLFRAIRPARKYLQLESYRLKSCEHFLGIDREDPYTGGELISVYEDYLKTGNEAERDSLLLHNAEDLSNLPPLLPLLRYVKLPELDYCLSDLTLLPGENPFLRLEYRMPLSLPRSRQLETPEWRMELDGECVFLEVRLFKGELKHFYPDYRNYYYMPSEDCAWHRSVAQFSDPRSRVKATRETAYERKSGIFLPQPSPVFQPVFKKSYKDRETFAYYKEEEFREPEKARTYLAELLKDYRP